MMMTSFRFGFIVWNCFKKNRSRVSLSNLQGIKQHQKLISIVVESSGQSKYCLNRCCSSVNLSVFFFFWLKMSKWALTL